MHRILFICLGNICRSVTAQFVMGRMVEEAGLSNQFEIDSAATSTEELGNPIYPPMQACLRRHGIMGAKHEARQMSKADYDHYDMIIGMDRGNLRGIMRIISDDPQGKVRLLMEFAGNPNREVTDPWYTRNFDAAFDDITEGCRGLLDYLIKNPNRGGR